VSRIAERSILIWSREGETRSYSGVLALNSLNDPTAEAETSVYRKSKAASA